MSRSSFIASGEAVLPEIPKPRFQPGPPRRPANTRKPLPPHIVKQILAANSASMQAVPPWLEEMEARRRATKPERDKARSLRREADVERRARERRHLARWPKGKDG